MILQTSQLSLAAVKGIIKNLNHKFIMNGKETQKYDHN